MILICRNCGLSLPLSLDSCNECGTELPQTYDPSTHSQVYETLARSDLITSNAAQQRREMYPLDGSNPLNSIFGSFFTTGYYLRLSEECMNNLFHGDPTKVDHPADIKRVLASSTSVAEKIKAIADYFDTEVIGSLDDRFRDRTLRSYQLLDFDISGEFIRFLVDDLIRQREKAFSGSRLDSDTVRVTLYQNVLYGYYFRVGEELVGA